MVNAPAFGSPDLFVVKAPRSGTAEAFRSLRTSLQFLPAEKTRAFAVTSAAPDEGKSVCAANLAAVLAMTGRRVLLVDADLRQPRQADLFGLGKVQGLSQFLAGACGDEAIQESGVEGLDVLASGAVPPNPAELLERPGLAAALARWTASYDHVIFDTPPLLVVTDPLVVARRTGHVIVVARAAATRDKSLQRAVALLREGGVDILGTVLNDLSAADREYGVYGDGYYQGDADHGPKDPQAPGGPQA